MDESLRIDSHDIHFLSSKVAQELREERRQPRLKKFTQGIGSNRRALSNMLSPTPYLQVWTWGPK